MNFLGKRIELKGYQDFSGGLDTKENTTGTHSYVTKVNNYNIMFHVAPFLPVQTTHNTQHNTHPLNDI